MAKTKVVNRKRRRTTRKRRKTNPRRRKTRRYANAARRRPARRRRSTTRRRRNPQPRRYSPYRYSNPRGKLFDVDDLMEKLPPATLGVMLARWAIKLAGPMEVTPEGNEKPGWKHAIFAYIAAAWGSDFVGQLWGGDRSADYAEIAAYGYMGDLFLREFVFDKSDSWYRQNLYLGADRRSPAGSPYGRQYMGQTPTGTTFTDATGRTYVKGPRGWQLAGGGGAGAGGGMGAQPYAYQGMGAQPYAYEGQSLPMGGFSMSSALGGFSMNSALGQGVPPAYRPRGYIQESHGYDSRQRTMGDILGYGGMFGRR